MKVKELVEKTEAYKKLKDLRDDIQQAIEEFKKIGTVDVISDIYLITGSIWVSGSTIEKTKTRQLDVKLNPSINILIREELILLLKKKLIEIETKMESFEL